MILYHTYHIVLKHKSKDENEETLQILDNIKEKYESHHHVNYTPDAVKACVTLSDRYISDRFLPDKANLGSTLVGLLGSQSN